MLVIQINLKKSIDTLFKVCYKRRQEKKIKKVVDIKKVVCYN